MGHAISNESLRRFAAGTATRQESCSIVTHLLKGCPSCGKRLKSFVRPEPPADIYDVVFDRLERAYLGATSTQAHTTPSPKQLLAELDAQPESRQEMLVRNKGRYWSPELAELLRDRSYSHRFKDVHKMLHNAQLAVRIAERLQSTENDLNLAIAELRVRCLVQLAHSQRVLGDLEAAEKALATARAQLRLTPGNLLVRALVYEAFGGLRNAQFRFQDAIWFQSQAVSIYRDASRPHELAQALIIQANAHHYAGDPESALALLLEAVPKIDRDARLTLAACHTIVVCYIDLGEVETASFRFVELRSLYERIGDPLLRIREKRLEGRLMIAQGLLPVGLKLLQTARAEFSQRGLEYDAALTGLDLASGYHRLGRREELRRLLAEIHPVFRARKVAGRALASLVYLEQESSATSPRQIGKLLALTPLRDGSR